MATDPKAIGFDNTGKVAPLAPLKPLGEGKAIGFDRVTPTTPEPIEGSTPSEQYTAGYIPGTSLQDKLAKDQNGWDQFANFVAQTGVEALAGTVEAGSYLLDFQQHIDKVRGEEQEYSNWLADQAKELKEQARTNWVPVHLSEENQGFQPSSIEWWAANGGQGLGSTLSLLIPGVGAAKLGKLAGLGKLGQTISATVASRYAESTMEANQVYQEAIQGGASKEQAGKAAAKVWNTNWIFAIQDFAQFNAITKGLSSLSKGAKGTGFGQLIKQMASEGAEEAGQYIVSEEAKKTAVDADIDYFGAGFNKRLLDYINDDEFATSTLLGAIGGGVFHAAGKIADAVMDVQQGNILPQAKDKLQKLFSRGIQKEVANAVDDKITSQAITNIDFGQQFVDNFNKGRLPAYKAELEELKKSPDVDADAKQSIDNHIKDIDYLMTEESKLRNSTIPQELHKPILLKKLELNQTFALAKQSETELQKILQEAVEKELNPGLLDIKKAKTIAEAYKVFSMLNPGFTEKAATFQKMYENMLATQQVNPVQLQTQADEKIHNLTYQNISLNEKKAALQSELNSLTTPEGIAAYQQQVIAKKVNEEATAVLTNPTSTKEQLLQAEKNATDPDLKIAIAKKYQELLDKEREANIIQLQDVVESAAPTPEDLGPVEFDPTQMEADVIPPDFDPNLDFIPDDFDPTMVEPDVPFAGGITSEQASRWGLTPKETQDMVSRVDIETRQPKPATTQAKETNTEVKETLRDKHTVSTTAINNNSSGNPIVYHNNITGEVARPEQIFAIDNATGQLLVNTPRIQAGLKVILKIENDFPWMQQAGFKPASKENYTINVYVEGAQRPITQLRNADNKFMKEEERKQNLALRDLILSSPTQSIETTISEKNIGTPRTDNTLRTLEVLRSDFMIQSDGRWGMQVLPHNPVFGLIDYNGVIHTPNIGAMRGINDNPGIEDKVETAVEKYITASDLTKLRGKTIAFRTAPDGTLRALGQEYRTLTSEEVGWVRNNLDSLIGSQNFRLLGQVIYMPLHPSGVYKHTDDKGKPKTPDVVKLDRFRFHIVNTGPTANELLMPIVGKEKQKLWVIVGDDQLDNFLNNREFSYRLIDRAGNKSPIRTEGKERIVEAFDKLLVKQFKNVNEEDLNSEIQYTDPVTSIVYPTFYEYLVKTETLQTKLKGSITMGTGEDTSYSFNQVSLYLDPNPTRVVVDTTPDEDVITILDPEPIKPSEDKTKADKDLKKLIEELYDNDDIHLKPYETEGYVYNTLGEKEIQWFKDHIGEDHLTIAKYVDSFVSRNGVQAFGEYYNSLVTVADYAPAGTAYHEAFHFLFDPNNGLIGKREKESLLESTTEERLAEEFERYKLSDGEYKPKVAKAKNFFRRILQLIKNLLGFKSPLEKLFSRFSNVKPGDIVINPNLVDRTESAYKLLPGFIKSAQQRDALQAFASEMMRYANEASREANIDLVDFFTKKGNVETILGKVKDNFTQDYNRIVAMPIDQRSKGDMGRYLGYLAMGIGKTAIREEAFANGEFEDTQREGLSPLEGFKTKALKELGKWGFRVRLSDRTIYEIPQTDDEQIEKQELKTSDEAERLYNIDSTQVNPTDSLSQRVRLFLSTIPEPVTDKEGRPTDRNKVTAYGTPKYIDFKRVDAALTLQLVNAIDPLARLNELSQSHPIAKVVLDRLMDEKNKGNDQVYTEFFVKYRRDSYTKKSVLIEKVRQWLKPEDRKTAGKDYEIIHKSKLIDTDRNSVDRVLVNKWREEGVRKKTIDTDGTVIKGKADGLLKEMNEFKARFIDAKNKKQSLPYGVIRDKFDSIMKALGIELPSQLWEELDGLKPSEKDATIQNWTFGLRRHSLEDLLAKYADGIDPFSGSNIISDLAERAVVYVENLSRGAYLNESGDQEYPNNTPSYITEFINNCIEYPEDVVSKFQLDSFYAGNAFLGVVKDKGTRSSLELEFTSSIKEGDKDPKDFQSRSEIESLIMRLTAFHNNAGDYAFINVGTPSDKTKQPMLSLPKYKEGRAKDFVMTVLNRNIDNESIRIQRIKKYTEAERKGHPLPIDIKNLKSAIRFVYVPGLDSIPNLAASISNGDVSPKEAADTRKAAQPILEKFLADEYELFLRYLQDNDLITTKKAADGSLEVSDITKKMPEGIFNNHKGIRSYTPEAFLKEFFYNDLAWRFEVSKVLQGDLAFYTNQDDYFKRQYQLVTPGYKPSPDNQTVITRGIYGKQFKVNDEEYLMSLVHLINPKATKGDAIYKDVISKYEKVNKTDAQSLMTIDAYKALAESLGQWTKDHETIYQLAWRNGIPIRKATFEAVKAGLMTEDQATTYRVIAAKVLLQPFKPFVFRDVVVTLPDGKTMLIKEQIKDSITVITPEMANISTGYKDLLGYMKANQIDIMSAEDTVKVGAYGIINDFSTPAADWQKRVTNITDFKFPQFIPDKKKEEVSGTQTHKLVLGNIDPKTNYQIGGKPKTGQQVIEDYNEYWVQKLEESSDGLKKKLGITRDGLLLSEDPQKRADQLFKLHLLLKQELGEREINENYWDVLDLIKRGAERVDFTLPLSFPAFGPKFQSILTNLWKKEVIKQKSPGYSAVNLADFGIGYSDELKFVRNEGGEIVEAEIGLPIDYVSDIGLKYGEHILPNGTILWEKLKENQKEALQFILYRIPTSNKSSMLPVRVVRITPPHLNNIVMIPGELTIQQGLDFDVDKSQLIRRVLKEGKIDRTDVDTKLFELYWGILMNKAHTLELLTPLASPTMEAKLNEFRDKGIIQSVERSSPLSTTADVQAEVRNKDGQQEIGIASRFNTGHTVLQTIKDYVGVKAGIGISHKPGYAFTEVGRTVDADGMLISTNHAESQQAALDAAKTPLLAYFNVVKGTMAAFHTMLEFGVPLPTTIDFFMQPVLKEWTKFYKQEGQSVSMATEKLYATYPGIVSQVDVLKRGSRPSIRSVDLTANLVNTIASSYTHSANVLLEFLDVLDLSGQMSNINNVISVDTFQDATGLEALQSFNQQKDVATNESAAVYIDPRVFNLETAPKSGKRLAAFFKYGIEDAISYISQFYPSASEQYEQMREHYAKAIGEEVITDKKLIKKLNQFTDYFLLQYDSGLFRAMTQSHPLYNVDPKLDKSDYRLRWSFFDPSRSIWKYINSMIEAKGKDGNLIYPSLQRNELLKNLESEESRQNEVQIIGVRNTDAQGDKTDYINAWWDLITNTNDNIKTLGYDLVRYAVQTSAFQFSVKSFYELIPVQYWVETGIGSLWDGISKNPTIDVESDIVNFIRHNFRSLDRFPTIYTKEVKGQIQSDLMVNIKQIGKTLREFTLKGDYKENKLLPRFVRVLDREMDNYRLYESDHKKNNPRVYKEVQPLGGRGFVEVSAERMPSNHSGVKAKYPNVSANPWKGVKREFPMYTTSTPGTNNYIEKYIPNGKTTAHAVIDLLLENETGVEAKKTLEVLLRNVSKITTPIESKHMVGPYAGALKVVEYESGGIGTVIQINSAMNLESEAQLRGILLHELIHAYSVGVIQKPEGETQQNFVRNIDRLRKEFITNPVVNKEAYALTDNFEFVAELASNKNFRSVLKKEGFWSRLIRNIRKLFGFKDEFDQALKQFYQVVDEADNLQNISPAEFSMVMETKEAKGSKRIGVLQQALSSLAAREKDLRRRWKRTEATELSKERKILEELVETNRNQAVVRYLLHTEKEMNTLKESYNSLVKDPKKINPEALNSMRDQLISYDILHTLTDKVYDNPEDFIPEGGDKETLLKQLNQLNADISRLLKKVERLGVKRFASFIKEAIQDPRSIEEIEDNLTVADRDIVWSSRWTDPGMDIEDPAIKAIAIRLKDNATGAYRKIQEDLYSVESKDQETELVTLQPNVMGVGMFWHKKKIKFKSVGILKALDDYEEWLKKNKPKSDSFSDKFSRVIDSSSKGENEDGVHFISPLTEEGRKILSIKEGSEDYPLRQFYETVVLGYVKSQEQIAEYGLRPGLRIPSIGRGFMEGFLREKGVKATAGVFTEQFLNNFRERFDDADYQPVDQSGRPRIDVPIRFTSKQDGQDGRLTTREVSLDIANTIPLFIYEMYNRKGLVELRDDLEIGKSVLAKRRVLKTKRVEGKGISPYLTRSKDNITLSSGEFDYIPGSESKSYEAYNSLLRRFLYGQVKAREGDVKIKDFKVSISKAFDFLLKATGARLMLFNVAIPLTNYVATEFTFLKEVVGGNIINRSNWLAGQKLYGETALAGVQDLMRRDKKTHFGRVFTYFNPMDTERPVSNLGVDSNWMRTTLHKITSSGSDLFEYKLAVNAMGAVMDRFKVTSPEGKEVSLYEGLEVTNDGKVDFKKGYSYNGSKTLKPELIDDVIQYTLRLYQSATGIRNRMDQTAASETIVGRAVEFMRKWLKPGLNARFKTRHFDEKIHKENEGHYVSSLILYNNIFGRDGWVKNMTDALKVLVFMEQEDPNLLLLPEELTLSEERQQEIINLRQANIRKTAFELYAIVAMSFLLWFGWDDDDEDSGYIKYMTARVRRELMTFIDPTTAWDVLRSPTVALNTIEGFQRMGASMIAGMGAAVIGEDQPTYQSGPYKGQEKMWADIERQFIPFRKQFEDMDSKTRLVIKGYK